MDHDAQAVSESAGRANTLIAPDSTLSPDSTVTLGVVWTVVAALLGALISMFVYVRLVLNDYLTKAVYNERELARTERWNDMKATMDEMREDIKAIRRSTAA
jgi:hypothetical protein